MLYIDGRDNPLGQKGAQQLRTKEPKIVRHTKAWVDDSELCLDVDCRLNDGTAMVITMSYCWDSLGRPSEFQSPYYFMIITEWLLNDDWPSFYQFVQKRLDESLTETATKDVYQMYDE
jgi:hypothetical protein